jgi:AraC-like DNA-binding protein
LGQPTLDSLLLLYLVPPESTLAASASADSTDTTKSMPSDSASVAGAAAHASADSAVVDKKNNPRTASLLGFTKRAARALVAPFGWVGGWIGRNLLRIVLLVGGVVVIAASSFYILSGREKQRFLTTTRLSIMDKEVQRACRSIEKNFADRSLDIGTLCTHLVTGEAFLQALFERELGMAVEDFITQVRINRARIILSQQGPLPALQISAQVGYSSDIVFLQEFYQTVQISFEEYCAAVPSPALV